MIPVMNDILNSHFEVLINPFLFFVKKLTMRTFLTIGLIGIIGLGSCQDSTPTQSPDAFQALLDSTYSANPGSRGMLISIDVPSKGISWTNALGWADSAAGITLQKNTPVLIASITKSYMAAATLRLCELYPVKIDSAISSFIDPLSDSLLRTDGYKTDKITLAHLLSNSSGMADFVETDFYQSKAVNEPNHVWTRQEQIRLAVSDTDPLGEAGSLFHYSDLNFILIGEIFEHFTQKPFYQAVRDLLAFEKNGHHHTWWNEYEEAPSELPPLAHQFARAYHVDSRTLHPSFDLFGAGGIVSTAGDLARFSSLLFSGAFFSDSSTVDLLTTINAPKQENETDYRLGLMAWESDGFMAYGHGGFWGTMFQYYPDIQTSIVVCSMERDYWRETIALCNNVAQEIREKQKRP